MIKKLLIKITIIPNNDNYNMRVIFFLKLKQSRKNENESK